MSYEGVVILGMPRSGTTLLRRLLGAHPALHCPPETNVLRGCARLLIEEPTAQGITTGVTDALSFAGMPDVEVMDRLREFAFGIFRTLRDANGRRIWVEKSALDAFHASAVERICAGHCRFVIIHRHPLDAVCSMHEYAEGIGLYVEELHRFLQVCASPLEALALAWSDTNSTLMELQERQPHDAVTISYETLVTQPGSTLGRLLQFLELDGDPDEIMRDALSTSGAMGLGDAKSYGLQTITASSVGRWRRLPAPLISRLVPIVAEVADRLGYSGLPRVAPATRDQYRRQMLRTLQLIDAKRETKS